MMRISVLILIVLLLAVCVTLAATNPTKQEYRTFLEAELARAMDKADRKQTRDSEMIRDMLKTQGPKFIESIVGNRTIRSDYGLFSLFETRVLGVEVSFLGIARRFVPLSDQKELNRALDRIIPAPAPAR